MQIAVLTASLRQASYNRRLIVALERLAPDGVRFAHSQLGDIPPYNQDDDRTQSDPVKRLKAEIGAADGVLFATPEYNRSVPGVLKNAIDHASRPYGKSAWSGKPAGIIGVSIGAIGTAAAQQHLRTILAYLDMPTLGQPEAFIQWKDALIDERGDIAGDSRAFLQDWLDRFIDFVGVHNPAS